MNDRAATIIGLMRNNLRRRDALEEQIAFHEKAIAALREGIDAARKEFYALGSDIFNIRFEEFPFGVTLANADAYQQSDEIQEFIDRHGGTTTHDGEVGCVIRDVDMNCSYLRFRDEKLAIEFKLRFG